jgi:plastocyanin
MSWIPQIADARPVHHGYRGGGSYNHSYYRPYYHSYYRPYYYSYSVPYYTPSYSYYYYSPSYYSTPSYQTTVVTLADNYFQPRTIQVVPGTKVRFVNGGGHEHTVTSDSGLWDSGPMSPGGSYSVTFTQPGTYTFHCNFHNGMTGTIIVGY